MTSADPPAIASTRLTSLSAALSPKHGTNVHENFPPHTESVCFCPAKMEAAADAAAQSFKHPNDGASYQRHACQPSQPRQTPPADEAAARRRQQKAAEERKQRERRNKVAYEVMAEEEARSKEATASKKSKKKRDKKSRPAAEPSAAAAPDQPTQGDHLLVAPPPLDPAALQRPRFQLDAFEATWVAADWHEERAPRSYSGFFLPLIYSGLGDVRRWVPAPPDHYRGRAPATSASISAMQPFWEATFSHWAYWARLVAEAAAAGRLDAHLAKGLSMKATTIVPNDRGIDPWAFGAVPHLKPQAQNDLIEAALGPVESTRLYMSVSTLFTARGYGSLKF